MLFTMPGLELFYQRSGWQPMPSTGFLVGRRTVPTRHGAAPMMLFVSAKGNRHRSAFEHASVYFGEDPW